MAGYLCKIVIEDTHPPVWRRIMVPDKITFGELHDVIQRLFGWEDEHLHEFRIPADCLVIDGEDESWGNHYQEDETLIDPFFRNYKWVRYTYDFGDDWRHKIQIEKLDPDYTARSVMLMKFKGDNFLEDCGGLWGADEDSRVPFDRAYVEAYLNQKTFPIHEELQEVKLLKESMADLGQMMQKLLQLKPEILQAKMAQMGDACSGKISAMNQKIDAWKTFENTSAPWKLAKSERTQQELLMDLGETEANDYFKYLRIPRHGLFMSREEQVCAVAENLKQNPEYICYVLDPKEYQQLITWIKYPLGNFSERPVSQTMMMKLLALGLCDFERKAMYGEIRFATDIDQIIGAFDTKKRKQIYQMLEQRDFRLGNMIQVYGLIELEGLYEMYKDLYEKNLEKEAFFRYIYWHSRFNDFVDTVYRLDGSCYVVSKELDANVILRRSEAYDKELTYAHYTTKELEYRGDDLANRSDWLDILFTTLHYQMKMEIYKAQDWLFEIVSMVMNGDTVDQIIEALEKENGQPERVEVSAEVWTVICGLMLELEQPMLKGRSRLVYAKEKECSPWTLGMVSEQLNVLSIQKSRMYQFPAEVQMLMYKANINGSEAAIRQLVEYKETNHIHSEEYLYLLADACVIVGQTQLAESLIQQLKNLSSAGRKATSGLEARLQERYEVVDDEDDWDWLEEQEVQQPYVRTAPKVGRNDPCPCGSGKKYKKCCGRNS